MSGRDKLLQLALDNDPHVKRDPLRISNPDNLGPYWEEIGYHPVCRSKAVFKRQVQSGPSPIVVCAEQFHANRRENLRRLAAAKEAV